MPDFKRGVVNSTRKLRPDLCEFGDDALKELQTSMKIMDDALNSTLRRPPFFERTFQLLPTDIDYNGHVNQSVYAVLTENCLFEM